MIRKNIQNLINEFDINYELEFKLEFLHKCLTKKSIETSDFSDLISKIENDKISFSDSKITSFSAEWIGQKVEFINKSLNDAINALKGEDNCFSPKYIAILSSIRDKLLEN
jgi:hypothetical protein